MIRGAQQLSKNIAVVGLKEAQTLLSALSDPNTFEAGTKDEANELMKLLISECSLEYIKGWSRLKGYNRAKNDTDRRRPYNTTSPPLLKSFNVSQLTNGKYVITTEAGQVYKWLDQGTPYTIYPLASGWAAVRNLRMKSKKADPYYIDRKGRLIENIKQGDLESNIFGSRTPRGPSLTFHSKDGWNVKAKAVRGIYPSRITQRIVDHYREKIADKMNLRIRRLIMRKQRESMNTGYRSSSDEVDYDV
jgi:hypothetical protein